MSDASTSFWSNNPNAPRIPSPVYASEKTNFAGCLIGAGLYGFVVVLFFRCMAALLNPTNRKKGTQWVLVVQTAVMFTLATVNIAMKLDTQSFSNIDNREFPGGGPLFPGPLGYQFSLATTAFDTVTITIPPVNGWLVDGLLLYRCYIIYSMNTWVIVFPSLVYLTAVAIGIMFLYQYSRPFGSPRDPFAINLGYPFFWISLALNVLLTLMIVVRLALHTKQLRAALGPNLAKSDRLYTTIVTILVESCALYAVNFLLFIALWSAGSPAQFVVSPMLSETQVIASLLIILRIANRRALTAQSVISGSRESIHFRGPEKSTGYDGTFLDGSPTSGTTEIDGETPGAVPTGVPAGDVSP